MWGLAAGVVVATVAGSQSEPSRWLHRVAAALLVALAGLTTLTSVRTPAVWRGMRL
jgi:hypothetical protein